MVAIVDEKFDYQEIFPENKENKLAMI